MADLEAESERHIREAKESLLAHAEELGRRFKDAREKLDLATQITERPLVAVGAAFAVGALIALAGGSRQTHIVHVPAFGADASASSVAAATSIAASGGLIAALGAFALRFAKDVAVREVSEYAKKWWSARERGPAVSRVPTVEAFLRH